MVTVSTFCGFKKEWEESTVTDSNMAGTLLELRELWGRLSKTCQGEVMVRDKVADLWAWLEKEYGGQLELLLLGGCRSPSLRRQCSCL